MPARWLRVAAVFSYPCPSVPIRGCLPLCVLSSRGVRTASRKPATLATLATGNRLGRGLRNPPYMLCLRFHTIRSGICNGIRGRVGGGQVLLARIRTPGVLQSDEPSIFQREQDRLALFGGELVGLRRRRRRANDDVVGAIAVPPLLVLRLLPG